MCDQQLIPDRSQDLRQIPDTDLPGQHQLMIRRNDPARDARLRPPKGSSPSICRPAVLSVLHGRLVALPAIGQAGGSDRARDASGHM